MIGADAQAPGGDGHAPRVISGGKSDNAALPLLFRKLEQPVARAPQLEGAAGLKALAFEPYFLPFDLGFDERRALDRAGDPLRRRRAHHRE